MFSRTPDLTMPQEFGGGALVLSYKQGDGDTLLYVKNVFVFGTIRGVFLFEGVAVKVKDIHLVK